MENEIEKEVNYKEEEIDLLSLNEDYNYCSEKDPLDFEHDVKNIKIENMVHVNENILHNDSQQLTYNEDLKQEKLIIKDDEVSFEEYNCTDYGLTIQEQSTCENKNVLSCYQNSDNNNSNTESVQTVYETKSNEDVIHRNIQQIISEKTQGVQTNNEFTGSSDKKRIFSQIFVCKLCKAQLNSELDFPKHMQEHFSSDLCKEVSQNYDYMKKRMLAMCLKTKYKCCECEKIFSKFSGLEKHLSVHIAIKQYQHPKHMNELKEVLAKHLNDSDKPYHCSECNKKFSQSSYLKQHMLFHSGIKAYQCSICGSSYNRLYHLKQHMISHGSAKRYSCSECNKVYSCYTDLKRHMVTHGGEKRFRCSECSKPFFFPSDLKRHMILHTGVRPFQCSDCGRSYSYRKDLKKHLLTHT